MVSSIIAESVQGESHKRHDIVRQDNYLILVGPDSPINTEGNENKKIRKKLPEGVSIISVADGHGSNACPYSDKGSELATGVFCDIMSDYAIKYQSDMNGLFALLNKEGETTQIAKQIILRWEERVKWDFNRNRKDIDKPHKEDGSVDYSAVYKMYGSTLLGIMITPTFIFAFQLGDGDIYIVSENEVSPVIEGDKILGVETHSISKEDSWSKSLTRVINIDQFNIHPFMISISTDGWINSHASPDDFEKTCKEYFKLIREKGSEVIESNLAAWLSETSKFGCGDDITTVFAYFD